MDFICFGAEEEKEEVMEKVGKALEENFTELEKIQAKKAHKDEKPEAAKNGNGDVEMTDSDEKPKNGDSKAEGTKPGNLNPRLFLTLFIQFPFASCCHCLP